MSSPLTKRNINALSENNKILHAQQSELLTQISGLKAQVAQLSNDVVQLRQQVMISATNVGSGPTVAK